MTGMAKLLEAWPRKTIRGAIWIEKEASIK
jgi:hypothetical protein